ncbi:MAG: glycosyltransferase family 32 protein [Dysgonomonas sp.]
MSIPKIIHYCWFGPKPIPESEKHCIESWTKIMPDYEIMFWNENVFDINSVDYVKQAFGKNKFAFVSDYVRMKALYEYGGIYMDTDVEALKLLDDYLGNDTFVGFENRTMIGTAIIGTEKSSEIVRTILDYYENTDFVDNHGNIDTMTNVTLLSKILHEKGFTLDNRDQSIDDVHIYERDVFYPKKISNDEFRVTDQTATIHRMSGSWLTDRERRRGTSVIWRNVFRPALKRTRQAVTKILGNKMAKQIEIRLRNYLR